jgi:hypothetical protein
MSDLVMALVVVGDLAFKLCAYTLTAWVLAAIYRTEARVWIVALVRSGLGIVGGLSVWGVGLIVSFFWEPGLLVAPVLHGTARVLIWLATITLFYDRGLKQKGKTLLLAVLLTGWSFLLDLPILLGVTIWAFSGIRMC